MRVLVTGAGTGIGRATASVLTQRGHEVVATARRPEVLDDLDVAERLGLDVTDDASVAACAAAAGPVDVLVNNAGILGSGPLEGFPIEAAQACFETNALGPLRMTNAFLPAMRERGSGVIVNVTSVQGRVSSPLEGIYCASKHALEAMSGSLHLEVARFGIRVVVIEPGYVAPGMKRRPRHDDGTDPYAELRRQWEGTDDRLLGDAGRPAPEIVGEAIARAIEDPDTPLRVPVGADAEMILAARRDMDDAAFNDAMRAVLGITW